MKGGVVWSFLLSCILVFALTQRAHALICFPSNFFSTPGVILGSVHDNTVEKGKTVFRIKNLRTTDLNTPSPAEAKDDSTDTPPRNIGVEGAVSVVKEYIQDNNGERFSGSSTSSSRLYSIPDKIHPKDGDIIIVPENDIFTYLFTDGGILKKVYSTSTNTADSHTVIFRDTKVSYEFKDCVGVNKIVPLRKLTKECKKEVEFTVNDHSFTLSPGQSYHFKEGDIRTLHLLRASTDWEDICWKKVNSIAYILDSSDHYSREKIPIKNSLKKVLQWLKIITVRNYGGG